MINSNQIETIHIGGRYHIYPSEVVMLVAYINYTAIYLTNGKQLVIARTISRVQESLHPHGQFIRLNKSRVVNWAYVLHRTHNGLLLYNNEVVNVSRRRRQSILKLINK